MYILFQDFTFRGELQFYFYTFEIKTQVEYYVGDLAEMFGYNINQWAVCPGETLVTRVFLRVLRTTSSSYQTEIALRDPSSGKLSFAQRQLPIAGTYPTTSLQLYDLVFDDHWVSVGSTVQPGTYSLGTSMIDAAQNAGLPMTDATSQNAGAIVPMGTAHIADCSALFYEIQLVATRIGSLAFECG